MTTIRKWSGRETKALRHALRMSVRSFAPYLGVSERTVSKWEAGQTHPNPEMQAALDTALRRCDSEVLDRFQVAIDGPESDRADAASEITSAEAAAEPGHLAGISANDELDALELARRVDASDLSATTLERLEGIVDELAMAYARTPPHQLLPRVRQHLSYVGQLLDARKTLRQHRRLLVVGGWLSLLAATLHIDLRQRPAAAARLATARHLATEAGHDEIVAWCVETRAWEVLTEGEYRAAAVFAQQAQQIAPVGSSAHLQATAQEGRAWARMGDRKETARSLHRLAHLVSPLPIPEDPEHHYRYDPSKAVAYTATTLAWAGDPAAEQVARDAVAQLESAPDGVRRPRRIASAQLDLSLALLSAGKPDAAHDCALAAIRSGRIVPSNRWRAAEIVTAVETSGIAQATDLRDAYRTYCL